jgi:hypothetical protein
MSSGVDASPLHPVVIREWRLTPACIALLLHCHCLCGPFPFPDGPVTVECLAMLKEHGIIEESDRSENGWTTTTRGKSLVQLLCETPIPEKSTSFLDPRTGRRIG